MADMIYNKFPLYLGDGTIDLDSDTLKVSLHTSSYTPDATHDTYSDLTSEVASAGTGYTTGGETLTTVTWSEDSGTVTLSAANPSWTSATFTCRYAVVYDSTPLSMPLICLFDFSTDQTVSNGTFTLQFNASGILTIS